ncbi:putative U3 small nucleolar RNA-associated protein 11-like Protein [Tribolium castaneum]|uniref:U3 small nucleolar RNA-associated protein 11 n=1 Tax=Tribolium castaneum TaxID=7070 RepID=D6WCA4_TRICA|nr:PREDICTED: probable U3 small nucleolar RNA-associated protein 11 [Tribolium castaneum]EEZ98784.1 putative U3 small nucleolar RNA-associated protein 11-like Protein [Tribolium castaneum]|eukprot:XP_008190467.1 PREDICTED: probable U3 small nucleolar RNA-associated protein 11 [Tribolium castaneum]
MSVWKKAAKAHQKSHKERHQPEERKHLGLLEKKKDYVKRAQDFNEKKETLKLLRKRALNKNPDEFYHHMINSKTENGMHFEKETEAEDTPEQIRLMRSQDLKYITTKRTQELKKIEKLQAQLHLASVDHSVKNKHIYFTKNLDKDELKKKKLEQLSKKELPDVNLDDLAEAAKKKKHLYNELAKRINREKELSVIQQKIEIKRHVENRKNVLPPKRVRRGNRTQAPVYVWQYERKK